jgi:hypothetical protein
MFSDGWKIYIHQDIKCILVLYSEYKIGQALLPLFVATACLSPLKSAGQLIFNHTFKLTKKAIVNIIINYVGHEHDVYLPGSSTMS